MKNTALIPGRFQPFHLGHLTIIEKTLKNNDRAIIAIGSTVENFQPENPFTIGERIQMVEAALEEANISREKFLIIPVPNINNYALWPKYVELSVPTFEKIYTGSTIVRELFEIHNQTLKNPYKIIFIRKELKISATNVRELMLKNGTWEKLVPKSVATLLKKWNAVERIKNIQE